MVEYRVKDAFVPPELENTRLGGGIEAQMETFLYERVLSERARETVYAETEEQFRLRLDDSTPVGMWRGEFWGKWIISACRVARYKGDESLKSFIREAALRVIATADPDGYIGTYKDPMYVFPLDPEKAIRVVGWPTSWNWNIWCRKYTLWGLLESYMLTGDEAILRGAVRATDQMIDMLEANGVRLFDTGVLNGLPSGSIMKPLLILYRLTGDEKYLNFCLKAASEWERADGKIPNLISNAQTGMPLHRWYPWYKYPYQYNWGKVYEMQSCLEGLLELYRVTGDDKYFLAVKAIWRQLREHEYNPLFSVGFNDIFLHASELINAISEPCDVLHWMRLSFELYKLTGESEYMDAFEKAFLNPFLAASFSDGKWGARGVRSCGRHLVATNQSGMKYSHCCVNNMPRGYMNACQAFAFQKGDALYINMYTQYACRFEGARVEIGGSYLTDGRVNIAVNADAPADVFLRIPPWSAKTVVNGESVETPGEYHRVRTRAGANAIEIAFDMSPRIRDFHREPERYEDDDPRILRFITGNEVPASLMTWERRSTILYGPLLLTRSRKNGNTEEEMFHSDTICGKGFACEIAPVESDAVRNAYAVTLKNGAQTRTLRMCDYATGTNEWSPDEPALFNIYV